MKRAAVLAVLAAMLVLAVPALARRAHYFPRAGHACRSGYLLERPRVRERRDGKLVRRDGRVVWVRRRECFLKSRLRYRAKVDPSFTQSVTDPLAVTYAYSADAFAGNTNLALVDALPAGVLNFYSSQTPGGPQSLYCSLSVGGATSGGGCPISYSNTGTYEVTTQYIPDSVTAVTETDQETIEPFATTTSLSVGDGPCDSGSPPGYAVAGPYCEYTLTSGVADQNGNVVGSDVLLQVTADGEPTQDSQVPANGSCTTYVTSSWVLSPDCNFGLGSGVYDSADWTVATAYSGAKGWSPSQSDPTVLTP